MPGGDGVLDLCRGFRCPHCGACSIFPPPAALCAEELARLLCSRCGRNCGTYAVGLLETEKQLRLRMEKLDEASESCPRLETLRITSWSSRRRT